MIKKAHFKSDISLAHVMEENLTLDVQLFVEKLH